MKKIFYIFFFSVSLIVTLYSCVDNKKTEIEPPTYSYTEAIVDPPDKFRIVFNISWIGSREATVTFNENAVWNIEKLGDGRVDVFIRNDQEFLSIVTIGTLGIQAGTYRVEVKTYYDDGPTNYFLQFEKTDIDFEGFTPTF